MTDHYSVLGLSIDCSESAIKKAYRKKALEYHPDKCKLPNAGVLFNRAKEAYEVLSDYEKRKAYDSAGYIKALEEAQEQRRKQELEKMKAQWEENARRKEQLAKEEQAKIQKERDREEKKRRAKEEKILAKKKESQFRAFERTGKNASFFAFPTQKEKEAQKGRHKTKKKSKRRKARSE